LKSKIEQYREHAADCAKLAATATDDRTRAMLMHMADAWLRLVEPQDCQGRLADPDER
jgi:hypothetical protein